jgi:hypothetical protein
LLPADAPAPLVVELAVPALLEVPAPVVPVVPVALVAPVAPNVAVVPVPESVRPVAPVASVMPGAGAANGDDPLTLL